MARSIRIELPGALDHVMARGNRREPIYLEDEDRRIFLKTLGEACGRTGWRVHAYVLMSNHYHLLTQTPEANLVAGMQWLQNTYTRRLNTRHQLWGRVFGDRYKAVIVEGGSRNHYGSEHSQPAISSVAGAMGLEDSARQRARGSFIPSPR